MTIFDWINAHDRHCDIRQTAADCQGPSPVHDDIIAAVNASDDTKFLARSIVLLWYLGSWYEPDRSERMPPRLDPAHSFPQKSSRRRHTRKDWFGKSRAHPMGYSNLQFGYWSRDPHDPNDPMIDSNLGSSPQQFPEGASHGRQLHQCDVAIVGSGFAGSLIANELSQKGIKVVILEAGPGVQPNINDYMKRFYKASAKVPESPYPPELADSDKLIDPANVAAGRPTSLTLGAVQLEGSRTEPILIQTRGTRPFNSTYERVAGGTSHWLGTHAEARAERFQHEDELRQGPVELSVPDWPSIDY